MFNTEVLAKIDLLQKAFILMTGTLAAGAITVTAFGAALAKTRLFADDSVSLASYESHPVEFSAIHMSMQIAKLTTRDLNSASDVDLRNLLAATLDCLDQLQTPARHSSEVQAEIAATAALVGMAPKTGATLVNELNQALLYETVVDRIRAINAERLTRAPLADIG